MRHVTLDAPVGRARHTGRVVRVLVVVAVVVVLLLLAAWGLQRHLIYFPSGAVPPVDEVLPDAREVVLDTDDGLRLGAWFVPARGADRGVTVLVANGNAGNRAGRVPLADALADAGLSVLLFDYRGYGGNAGTPSEGGLALDVRAARRHLVEEEGVPPERVLYYGESLGAAVVTGLAADVPPGGVVLRSPFVDLAAVGREHYPFLPVRLLLRDEFPVASRVTDVDAPVTVVYGTADSVVPPAQSRTVAEAAPRLAGTVAVPGADHNDPALLDGRALVDAVVAMAEQVSDRAGG
jgi:uncharacterized protein